MRGFGVEPLTRVSALVLEAAGTPEDIAQRLAGWLVNANLSGHPSHGVMRVPQYVDLIVEGEYRPAERPSVVRETETTVLLDCRFGFGHIAAERLTRMLAEKAKRAGVAIGGVLNCTHIGRLGEWAELGAGLNVLLLMAAGGPGLMRVAPYGGAEGRMSTNPMAFGAPAGGAAPMIMDFATSATAEGKLRVARDKGVEVPPGQILDKHGQPSTKPNDFYEGGVMLPFGGHKGYGLMVMAEILGSNLTGAIEEPPVSRIGLFALAIDPDAFGAGEAYVDATRATFERLRDTRPAEGFTQVLIPGDPERRAREAGRQALIDVPEATWRLFLDGAAQVGLDPSEVERLALGG